MSYYAYKEECILTLDDIKEEIIRAKKIVILTHESPDGDAIRKFTCYVQFTKTIKY